MMPEPDVIIVGGGLVGASLALGLARENIRVSLIEAVPPQNEQQPSFDDRGLALSLSSMRVFDGLGVWQSISSSASPVKRVHVSDQHHFGVVRLNADDLHIPALGYVALARDLGKALVQQVADNNYIQLLSPAVVEDISVTDDHATVKVKRGGEVFSCQTRLVIAADGTHSDVRKRLGIESSLKDYSQTAIVTNTAIAGEHQQTAYERFTVKGPLALLPMPENRFAVVFTVDSIQAQETLDLPEETFRLQLQERFGRRGIRFLQTGRRKSYPLVSILAREQVRSRVVILGNAAHTIHPNGAQGFNLCLRDVAGLLDILVRAFQAGEDIGRLRLLEEYRQLRQQDQKQVEQFSDGIASIFYSQLPHRVLFRNSSMLLLDLCPPAKRAFMRRAMGITGRQPSLVRHNVS